MPSFIFLDSTGVGQQVLQFWTISGGEDFLGVVKDGTHFRYSGV